IGDRSSNMAEALSDLAGALAQAGRGAESPKLLDEAESLARGLKNNALLANVLNNRGDAAYYQGDLKSARSSYEQALQSASHSSDKDALLRSRIDLAKVEISEGSLRAAITDLRSLVQQADSQGRMYASLAASVLLADALVETKDSSSALRE